MRLLGESATFARQSWGAVFALTVVVSVSTAFILGYRPHVETARCPDGLLALGARCCAPGQTLLGPSCRGAPTSCPAGFTLYPEGCVVEPKKVEVQGGFQSGSLVDWQDTQSVEGPTKIDPLVIDAFEVSVARWNQCVRRNACAPLPSANQIAPGAPSLLEPGQPVTLVTPEQAEGFCRQAGGRLPFLREWVWVASGAEERRFPWGPNGLVCRRASYGLVAGPCAEGKGAPELAGARSDGQTPLGVADLAGNVAEWARAPNGRYRALGGSFRSRVAGELSVNAAFDGETPKDDIGFRCVYAVPQKPEITSNSTPQAP